MKNNYYEMLNEHFNRLLVEAQQIVIDFKNIFGEEVYNRFKAQKQRMSNPENDISYWVRKYRSEGENVIDELDEFISNYENKMTRSQKRAFAEEGAELIFEDDNWLVYHITTYEAAVKYGSHTKWCITGRYEGHEGRGQYWFNHYLGLDENGATDEDVMPSYTGYYFFIKKGNEGEKYAVCPRYEQDGKYDIWDPRDNRPGYIPDGPENVPGLPNLPVKPEDVVNDYEDGEEAELEPTEWEDENGHVWNGHRPNAPQEIVTMHWENPDSYEFDGNSIEDVVRQFAEKGYNNVEVADRVQGHNGAPDIYIIKFTVEDETQRFDDVTDANGEVYTRTLSGDRYVPFVFFPRQGGGPLFNAPNSNEINVFRTVEGAKRPFVNNFDANNIHRNDNIVEPHNESLNETKTFSFAPDKEKEPADLETRMAIRKEKGRPQYHNYDNSYYERNIHSIRKEMKDLNKDLEYYNNKLNLLKKYNRDRSEIKELEDKIARTERRINYIKIHNKDNEYFYTNSLNAQKNELAKSRYKDSFKDIETNTRLGKYKNLKNSLFVIEKVYLPIAEKNANKKIKAKVTSPEKIEKLKSKLKYAQQEVQDIIDALEEAEATSTKEGALAKVEKTKKERQDKVQELKNEILDIKSQLDALKQPSVNTQEALDEETNINSIDDVLDICDELIELEEGICPKCGKELKQGEKPCKDCMKEEWEDLNSYEDVVKFTNDCGGKWCCGLPKEKNGEYFFNSYARNGTHFVGDREKCILALKDKDGKIHHKADKDDRRIGEGYYYYEGEYNPETNDEKFELIVGDEAIKDIDNNDMHFNSKDEAEDYALSELELLPESYTIKRIK